MLRPLREVLALLVARDVELPPLAAETDATLAVFDVEPEAAGLRCGVGLGLEVFESVFLGLVEDWASPVCLVGLDIVAVKTLML